MAEFQISGDEISWHGYVVATIKHDAPSSIIEEFKRMLEQSLDWEGWTGED